MSKCVFIFNGMCTILTKKNCETCKFRKTEAEWNDAQERSKRRLASLGLEAVVVGKGHDAYVTTRRIPSDDEEDA